jgi:class 3 adenylate cyclase/tetratricopeptide (TPR) repeat protein
MTCAVCGHENPRDARFCNECSAPLAAACRACGAENPPGARFCNRCAAPLGRPPALSSSSGSERTPRDYTPKHLADKILGSKSALEGERKQVTVLFADVKSSLEISEQVDPEEWHRILDRFFQILADGVHRFEGTVNQYTGDGIMALFGAPIAHENHAQRACYAALYLRDGLRRYADELRVSRGLSFSTRIGLNSGEVVVGKIGDDLRMDYTAQGSTVGLAARMEQLAEPGKILLTQHSARLASGYFRTRDLGATAVKGLREPLHIFELEGVGALRTRFDLSRARGLARFVGRVDELRSLEAALDRCREGNGQVVGVVAEAGVGKSRLCFEFAERCRARGLAVYEGHAVAHGKNIPFLPILQVFRAYFGIAERDADRAAREKIAGRLLLLDEKFRETLPLLFELFGIPDPERPAPRLSPEARQRQIVAVLRRLVQRSDSQEPAVTLIEDLHWLDPGSEAYLEQWVEALSGGRGLLLVNFRPEYHAGWMQKSYYQQLPLATLGIEATRELLEDLLGRNPSVAGLASAIQARTAGNPFFTEEVVQSLVESGHLEGDKGSYRLATPIERLEVPSSVQALLASRIDRLPERDKQLLQTAAVIGRTFDEPTLEAVAELPRAGLGEALAGLEAAELVTQQALYPVAEYAFKHPLTQEVALRSQLQERRSQLHAAVARAIEKANPEKLDEKAALLAHHWEEAGDSLKAAAWHRRTADWLDLRNPEETLRHWRRCAELVSGLPGSPEVDGLRLASSSGILRGGLLGLSVGNQEVDAAYREGRSLAEESGDLPALAAILINYQGSLRSLQRDQEALAALDEAVRVADRTGDRGLRAAARTVFMALMIAGRLEDMRARSEEGLKLVEGDPHLGFEHVGFSPLVGLTLTRGWALCTLGRLREGLEALDRGGELVRQHDPRSFWHGMLLMAGVIFSFLSGRIDRVMRVVQELPADADDSALPLQRDASSFALGLAHLVNGEWQEAIQRLESIRFSALQADHWLAEAHLGAGDSDRARACAERALAGYRERGTLFFELVALPVLARVLRTIDAAGERQRIDSILSRAEELVRQTGARTYAPFICEERGRLAQELGSAEEADRQLREAHRLFSEIGAPGQAERLAEELGL